jgi:antitoxin component YwqK of YwqJK toxin-antitoxin module
MNKLMIFAALTLLVLFAGCVAMTDKSNLQNNQTGLSGNDGSDIQNGMRTRWYQNGMKAEEVEFSDGRKTGNYTAWYENGQMKLKCRFHNDILDGEASAWFEDGRKRFLVHFTNGKRHGKWIRYHEKRDAVVASMSFNRDKLDGDLSAAYEQGNGNGIGRSYAINSVFQDGDLIESFRIAYTNVYGHAVMVDGKLSENGDVKFDKQKNITMKADGTLSIDYGHSVKSYKSLQDYFIAEINLRVMPKFSLDFCNRSENIWPCHFPLATI